MSDPANTVPESSVGGAFGFVRNGYDRAHGPDVSTSVLENATVHGRGDDVIGAISALNVDTDGRITSAVIDVGGFLGIGAHCVLLPFEQLTILRQTDGSDISIHLDATKDQLKLMPHHGG